MKIRMMLAMTTMALSLPAIALEVTVGDAAPAFELPDSHDKTVKLSDHAGKIVVLEWLNHDCPFVKKNYNTGNMQALQKKYTGQGVIWLSINSSAPGKQGQYPAATWNEMTAAKAAAPTAVLLDPDGKVGRAYGAKTTPHMYIVAADGKLAYQGALDDRPNTEESEVASASNYVAAALDELLAGKPVTTAVTKPYGCSVKY